MRHAAPSSTALLARRLTVAGTALASAAALLLSVTTGLAVATGGNDRCPPGTTPVKIEVQIEAVQLGQAYQHVRDGYTFTLVHVTPSTFTWTSSDPVHTVIVKGGSELAISTPVNGATSGTGTAPLSPSDNGQPAGVSNVTFCFGDGLQAGGSASPSASASSSVSPSASASASASPSASASSPVSPSASPSPSASSSASILPGGSSGSASPSVSAAASPAGTTSSTPEPSPSITLIGGDDSPATGGGGATSAPEQTTGPDVVVVPADGLSTPLPATGPLPAAPAGGGGPAAEQPSALPFTGLALSALLLFGLVLVASGTGLALSGRRRPAHAARGIWSR